MTQKPPFERTRCACALDVSNCRTQPGYLIPDDLTRLATLLSRSLESMRDVVQPSRGALVGDASTGRTFRIGTMTPRRDPTTGACVFLTDVGLCSVHDAAPYGCAYFDVHQTREQSDVRSLWGLRLIVRNDALGDRSYRRERELMRCEGDPE